MAAAAALLDLLIYWQHRLFHLIPLFWRMPRMHHADLDFDVITALRFHSLEIVLSMGIKLVAVLIFEVLLSSTAMFNHGNMRLSLGLDRWLRLLVVTPDMHWVHHFIEGQEYNSNFGINLPWWDRLFRTYREQPAAGHIHMRIGLRAYSSQISADLIWMLVLSFKSLRKGSDAAPRGHENDED